MPSTKAVYGAADGVLERVIETGDAPVVDASFSEDDYRRARNYLRDQAQRYLSHTDRGIRDLSIYAQSQLGDFEDVNG